MAQHRNFYETIGEARMRLDETVVLYDNVPYHVLCISDHNSDGIFRVYIDPVSDNGAPFHRHSPVPYTEPDEEDGSIGETMDSWLETPQGKKSPVLRKMMNSPKFNKFRPFPIGMVNTDACSLYIERSPTRHTQQGLTGAGLSAVRCDLAAKASTRVSTLLPGLYSAILGLYPDLDMTLTNLTDETVSNSSAAFHREFCLVRGPMNMLFLSYKGDIVGYLPYNNTEEVKIGSKFSYVKEVVDELSCFTKIS